MTTVFSGITRVSLLERSDEVVVLGVGLLGALEVALGGQRPHDRRAALGVLVPAVGLRPSPGAQRAGGTSPRRSTRRTRRGEGTSPTCARSSQHLDRAEHVAGLALQEEDEVAVQDEVGVRPVEAEEVREVRQRRAPCRHRRRCPRSRAGPCRRRPVTVIGMRKSEALNPVPKRMTSASTWSPDSVHTPSASTRAITSRDQVDVVALEGRHPGAVVADDPLGARRVVRDDLAGEVRPVAGLCHAGSR